MRHFPSLLSICLATFLAAPSAQATEAFPSAGEMATEGELEVWNDNILYSKGDTTVEFGPDIVAISASALAHGFDAKLPVYELKDARVNMHGAIFSSDSMVVIPALGEIMTMGELHVTAKGPEKSGPQVAFACASSGTIRIDGVDTGNRAACANDMAEAYCTGALVRTRLKHGCMGS